MKQEEEHLDNHRRIKPLLKRLKPGRMLDTMPERLALARLQILLAGEIARPDSRRPEDFDWTAAITVNRRMLDTVFSLDSLNRHEHVTMAGPVGVGKSFLALAIATPRCRQATAPLHPDRCLLQDPGAVQDRSHPGEDLHSALAWLTRGRSPTHPAALGVDVGSDHLRVKGLRGGLFLLRLVGLSALGLFRCRPEPDRERPPVNENAENHQARDYDENHPRGPRRRIECHC